jgi:hypothetical protein
VDGKDEDFSDRANRTIIAGTCKTARRVRIASHYEFATHRSRARAFGGSVSVALALLRRGPVDRRASCRSGRPCSTEGSRANTRNLGPLRLLQSLRSHVATDTSHANGNRAWRRDARSPVPRAILDKCEATPAQGRRPYAGERTIALTIVVRADLPIERLDHSGNTCLRHHSVHVLRDQCPTCRHPVLLEHRQCLRLHRYARIRMNAVSESTGIP